MTRSCADCGMEILPGEAITRCERKGCPELAPHSCPACGSEKRDARAVMSFKPLALCRDPWHQERS